MEASEPKWVNPDGIHYGVNSLWLGCLNLLNFVCFHNFNLFLTIKNCTHKMDMFMNRKCQKMTHFVSGTIKFLYYFYWMMNLVCYAVFVWHILCITNDTPILKVYQWGKWMYIMCDQLTVKNWKVHNYVLTNELGVSDLVNFMILFDTFCIEINIPLLFFKSFSIPFYDFSFVFSQVQ